MTIFNILLEYIKMMLDPVFLAALVITGLGYYWLKRQGYRFAKGVWALLGVSYVIMPLMTSTAPQYNGIYAFVLLSALTTALYRLKKEEV